MSRVYSKESVQFCPRCRQIKGVAAAFSGVGAIWCDTCLWGDSYNPTVFVRPEEQSKDVPSLDSPEKQMTNKRDDLLREFFS